MEQKYKIGQTVYCVVRRLNHLIVNKGFVSNIRARHLLGKLLDLPCSYQVTGCGTTTIPEWTIFESEEEAKEQLQNTQNKIFPFVNT